MSKWYTSFHYPYGYCITNGKEYVSELYRYPTRIITVSDMDDAGYWLGEPPEVLVRYLNIIKK